MKKSVIALFAFLLCASSGCDTSVDKEDITSLLAEVNTCTLTGGTPITDNQGKIIQYILESVNNPNCLTNNGEFNRDCDSFKQLKSNALVSASSVTESALINQINGLKQKAGSKSIAYNSALMYPIYEYVKETFPEDAQGLATYCACGYEFCEKNAECKIDQATQLPVCAISTANSTLADDSCAPVLVKDTALANWISTTIFPLMWKVSALKSKVLTGIIKQTDVAVPCTTEELANTNPSICKDEKDVTAKPSYLLKVDCNDYFKKDKDGNITDPDGLGAKCNLATMMYGFITNCVNPTADESHKYVDLKQIKRTVERTCPASTSTTEGGSTTEYTLKYFCDDSDAGKEATIPSDAKDWFSSNACTNKREPSFYCVDSDGNKIKPTLVANQKVTYTTVENNLIAYLNNSADINQIYVDKAYYNASNNAFYPLCVGETIVAGNDMPSGSIYSYYYYNLFRKLTKELILYGQKDKDKEDALSKIVTGKDYSYLDLAIDEFLTEHLYNIYQFSDEFLKYTEITDIIANAAIVTKNGVCKRSGDYPDYCEGACVDKDNCNNDSSAIQYVPNSNILSAMKKYYQVTYTNKTPIKIEMSNGTFTTLLTNQQMHYLFYAYLAGNIADITDNDKKGIMNSTFSMNLECVTQDSGIGDPAGLKKYCSANSDAPISIKNILDALENSQEYKVRLAYSLISQGYDVEQDMNMEVTADNGDKYNIYIDPNAEAKDVISYQKAGDSDAIKKSFTGKWKFMRCPSGASCSGTQCGVCANTSIPQTLYDLNSATDSYVTYENATCKDGQIVVE